MNSTSFRDVTFSSIALVEGSGGGYDELLCGLRRNDSRVMCIESNGVVHYPFSSSVLQFSLVGIDVGCAITTTGFWTCLAIGPPTGGGWLSVTCEALGCDTLCCGVRNDATSLCVGGYNYGFPFLPVALAPLSAFVDANFGNDTECKVNITAPCRSLSTALSLQQRQRYVIYLSAGLYSCNAILCPLRYQNVTIVGPGGNKAIIDCGGAPTCFHIPVGYLFALTSVVVQNSRGSAMNITAAPLFITDVHFRNHRGTIVEAHDSQVSLTSVTVVDCFSSTTLFLLESSQLTAQSVAFAANVVTSPACVFACSNCPAVAFTSSNFTNNTAGETVLWTTGIVVFII